MRAPPVLPLLLALRGGAVGAGPVQTVVSSAGGARMEPGAVPWGPAPTGAALRVDDAQEFQEMDGFGASVLESGAMSLNALPPAKQDELLSRLFDPDAGSGFSAAKADVAASDMMPAGGWYSYDDVSGDVALRNFSVARDLTPNGTLTLLKRIQRHLGGAPLALHATMDYPPDWMLNSSTPLPKADINRTYYPALAQYFLKYTEAYRAEGVGIDYLSLFNEPADSYTDIRVAEIRDLLSRHVGPAFRQAGSRTRLVPASPSGRADALLQVPRLVDAATRPYVDAVFYHGYDCQWECEGLNCTCCTTPVRVPGLCPSDAVAYDAVRLLRAALPAGMKLWMTEVCYATEFGDYPLPPRAPALPRRDFDDGAFWGHMIVSDILAGASAWVYWNMILDETGGPFLVSPQHNDPKGNAQHPVVIVDRPAGDYVLTGVFWYLSHFSKYVRPGMHRVAATGPLPQGVEAVAFAGGAPRRVVLQLLNAGAGEARVGVAYGAAGADAVLPPASITTLMWDAGAR